MAIFANEEGTLKTLSDVQGATSPINIDLIFEDITLTKNDSDGYYTLGWTSNDIKWYYLNIYYKKIGIIDISKYKKLILLNHLTTDKIHTDTCKYKINGTQYPGTFQKSHKLEERILETDTNFIESYSRNFLDDNKQYPYGIGLAGVNDHPELSWEVGLPYNTETGEIYLRASIDQASTININNNCSLLGILK